MEKNLQKAIKNVLSVRVDSENYGMLSTKKNSHSDLRLLYENNIDIHFGYYSKGINGQKNVIVRDNKVIAKIEPRYSSRKVNGMYKQLQPKIEWL